MSNDIFWIVLFILVGYVGMQLKKAGEAIAKNDRAKEIGVGFLKGLFK